MVTEHLTSDMFPLVAARCYDSDVYLTEKLCNYIRNRQNTISKLYRLHVDNYIYHNIGWKEIH